MKIISLCSLRIFLPATMFFLAVRLNIMCKLAEKYVMQRHVSAGWNSGSSGFRDC